MEEITDNIIEELTDNIIEEITDNEINKVEKKKRGRKFGGENTKDKYKLTFKDNEYICKSYKEIKEITSLSLDQIYRISKRVNRSKRFNDNSIIKIEKIEVIDVKKEDKNTDIDLISES